MTSFPPEWITWERELRETNVLCIPLELEIYTENTVRNKFHFVSKSSKRIQKEKRENATPSILTLHISLIRPRQLRHNLALRK